MFKRVFKSDNFKLVHVARLTWKGHMMVCSHLTFFSPFNRPFFFTTH